MPINTLKEKERIMEPTKGLSRRTFMKSAGLLGTSVALGIGFPHLILGKGEEDYVVRLGYYDCDHMTAAPIAKEAGIFADLGLKVEVTGNGKVPEAMAAGQMDVGYIGFVGMTKAIIKGSPMAAVAHNHKGGSMYLVARHGIDKPEDLLGKKVALGPKPESNNGWWVTYAMQNNIPKEAEHYQNFVMTDRDEYLALKTGNLDAFWCCDPWGSMAEYENTGKIIRTFDVHPNGTWGICCAQVMNRTFIKEHPKIAQKMVIAHVRAIQHIYMKPIKSAEIFAASYHVPFEVGLMTIYKKTVGESRTLRWNLEEDAYRETVSHNINIGIFPSAPEYKEVVDTTFLAGKDIPDFESFIKNEVDPVFPFGMSYADWKKKATEMPG
jgi:NitT/TauT family transport system substrate-binding protein